MARRKSILNFGGPSAFDQFLRVAQSACIEALGQGFGPFFFARLAQWWMLQVLEQRRVGLGGQTAGRGHRLGRSKVSIFRLWARSRVTRAESTTRRCPPEEFDNPRPA